MTLTRIYKVFGGFHMLFGIILLSGLLHLPVDWLASVGNPIMGLNFFFAMMVLVLSLPIKSISLFIGSIITI